MPSQGGDKKKAALPVINLDQIIAAQARPANEAVGGITTTSDIELFPQLDQNDPIFQQAESTEQQKKQPSVAASPANATLSASDSGGPAFNEQDTGSSTDSEESNLIPPAKTTRTSPHEMVQATSPHEMISPVHKEATQRQQQPEPPARQEKESVQISGGDQDDMSISDGSEGSQDVEAPQADDDMSISDSSVDSTPDSSSLARTNAFAVSSVAQKSVQDQEQARAPPQAQPRSSALNEQEPGRSAETVHAPPSPQAVQTNQSPHSETTVPADHNKSMQSSEQAEQEKAQKNAAEQPSPHVNSANIHRSEDDDSSDSTPRLMEPPQTSLSLDEAEKRLFDGIDRVTLDAQEKELMIKIDHQILAAEEKELLATIDTSIRAAEEASKRGGRVLYLARVNDDGSLDEEYPHVLEDPLYVETKTTRQRPLEDEKEQSRQGPGSRVLDIEDVAVDVVRTMRLPKYAGNTKQRPLNRKILREQVINKLMERERRRIPSRKISARLDNDPDDPHSLLLRSEGHLDLVKEVESQVSRLITEYQIHVEANTHAGEAILDDATYRVAGRTSSEMKELLERQRKGHSAYSNFCEFYKDVKDIEYTSSVINKQTVNKCMWKRHKDRYGTNCDDNCACTSDLPFLTGTVLKQYMTNERKKDPNSKPVGFVNHFAPKFYGMLKSEYPEETPKQILQRLVTMWGAHRRVSRFGIRCSDECPCREGWELVFHKGRTRNSKANESQPQESRKRASGANSRSSAGQFAPVPRSTATIARKAARRESIPAPPVQYEIIFDPGELMGFFCVTEPRKDGPVCKIASVNDYGRSKDGRLQIGTIITEAAVSENGDMLPVRTHTDLKRHYESARDKSVKLRVRCLNPAVGSSLIQNISALGGDDPRNAEWNRSGEWLGPTTKGWPGGARFAAAQPPQRAGKTNKDSRKHAGTRRQSSNSIKGPPGADEPSHQIDRNADSSHQSDRNAVHERSSDAATQNEPSALQFFDTTSSAQPIGHQELVSILRRPQVPVANERQPSLLRSIVGPRRRNLEVKFADNLVEKRYYIPKSPCNRMAKEIIARPPDGESSTPDGVPQTSDAGKSAPGTRDLIEAIHHKDFQDVIALLQAGVSATKCDENNMSPKDHVKKDMDDLKAKLVADPGNRDARKREKDFILKRRVLSIFIESAFVINRARFNKLWQRFDFKVEKITDLRLSVRGEDDPGSHVLDCRILIKGEKMPSMPLISMNTNPIEWESPPRYSANYNPYLTDGRMQDIVISLYKGDGRNDRIAPIHLGEIVIPMSRISAEVESGKGVMQEKLPSNDYLVSGGLVIQAQKVSKDGEFLERKTQDICAKMAEVIEWIKMFDKDSGSTLMAGNITDPINGLSLLHAAIFLERPDFIKQLLDLGADPTAPSALGSPRMLAANMMGDRKGTKSLEQSDARAEEIMDLLKGVTPTHAGAQPSALDDVVAEEATSDSLREMPDASDSRDVTAPYEQRSASVADAVSSSGTASPFPLDDGRSIELNQGSDNGARFAAPSETGRKTAPTLRLPSLERVDWVANPSMRRCRHFNKTEGCRFGNRCHHLHISSPVGSVLDDEAQQVHDVEFCEDYLSFEKRYDNDGRMFCTAAYWDPKENIIYNAERGRSVGQSSQGIYWYSSEDDAKDALKRVVMFSRNKLSGGNATVDGGKRLSPPMMDAASRASFSSRFEPAGASKAGDKRLSPPTHEEGSRASFSSRFEAAGASAADSKSLPPPMQDVAPLASFSSRFEGAGNTAPAPRQLDNPQALPLVDRIDWVASPTRNRCRFFNTAKGCNFGEQCNHLHVRSSIGSALDDVSPRSQFRDVDFRQQYVTFQEQRNQSGRWFYTAAYWDPKENIIYYAERGRSLGQNAQGIYWYMSKADAEEALKRVVVFSRDAALSSPLKRTRVEDYYGPSQPKGKHAEGGMKREVQE